jgi:hypothetical protein
VDVIKKKCTSRISCDTNCDTKKGEKIMTGRLQILSEFYQFMKERKKWWLGPIMIMLLLLGLLIILTEGSAVAPFVYALF